MKTFICLALPAFFNWEALDDNSAYIKALLLDGEAMWKDDHQVEMVLLWNEPTVPQIDSIIYIDATEADYLVESVRYTRDSDSCWVCHISMGEVGPRWFSVSHLLQLAKEGWLIRTFDGNKSLADTLTEANLPLERICS